MAQTAKRNLPLTLVSSKAENRFDLLKLHLVFLRFHDAAVPTHGSITTGSENIRLSPATFDRNNGFSRYMATFQEKSRILAVPQVINAVNPLRGTGFVEDVTLDRAIADLRN